MNVLTDPIKREREYGEIVRTLETELAAKSPRPLRVTGLCEGANAAFTVSLIRDMREKNGRTCLCLVPDEKDVNRLSTLLTDAGLSVRQYPWRDFNYYSITASHEFEHERLSVLNSVLSGECDAVVTTPDAALQYTMPQAVLIDSVRTIRIGDTLSIPEFTSFLVSCGYIRTETVDGPGQFAVRGGIIDVFPPSEELPVRIDLFGDEIDGMGQFDILTQRRTEAAEGFTVTPAREIVLSEKRRSELITYIQGQKKRAKTQHAEDIFAAEAETLQNGADAKFTDKYISFIYPERECLLDYMSGITVCREYPAQTERLKAYEWRLEQDITSLLEEEIITAAFAEYGRTQADFEHYISSHAAAVCDTFLSSMGDIRLSGLFTFQSRQSTSVGENPDLLRDDVRGSLRGGNSVVLLCENETMAQNTAEMFAEAEIPAFPAPAVSGIPAPGTIMIVSGKEFPGYELSVSKFTLFSLYPQDAARTRLRSNTKKHGAAKKSSKERIMSYTDLEVGDYVVHAAHGIGQYMGINTVTASGVTRDYIKIRYAGSDILYLPCDQLEMLSKYIGAHSDDGTLKLSKMGGTEWTKAKKQVKAAAKEMAKELIRLYAERQRLPGFAFLGDDDLQQEFEEAFEYEETDGQLTAISEVKEDMEKAVPMDRLLCGDVGFGKTEVAMRAAFKAVESGKQVAFLVPTTILALQHYQTLLSRMRGFPVRTDMLSRFRSPKQQAESLRKLKRGETDIIVGTHRLVSADVEFRDLGLVIIDEEQRFGVAHKEKLKQLSKNVDVLTLTATPIPRTLNMAMSGIRDMSILEEAPGDRVPVQTYVLEYDALIIGDAIRKELRRGGQVFYLKNSIEAMEATVAAVRAMAPEARIAFAHGQMEKEQLSDIWRSMLAGDTDVLISTTIIESGIDVPNANTLIIEDADHFGLSQLHQLRGRVGRSSRRAYAYFTYKKGSVISDIASKRLTAIRDYTEFGSGFRIALRDLEIRGAGDLLGAQQHGNIESVGYDMYMRLLSEAILEEKGEKSAPKVECTVEIGENAYIPETYIRQGAQRIDTYKKISLIMSPEDLSDILDEVIDRYGDPPQAVRCLLNISLIRALGSQIGLSKLTRRESTVTMIPAAIRPEIWTKLAAEFRGRILMSLGAVPTVTFKLKKGEDVTGSVIELFKKYIQIQAEIRS